MGILGKNFKRFPHTCRIEYFDGEITGFESDEESEEVIVVTAVDADGSGTDKSTANGVNQLL